MDKSLLDILVDPISKTPLLLEQKKGASNHVVEGTLRGAEGRSYPISNSIPRFVLTEDQGQRQTGGSFGFKWGQRETYESPEALGTFQKWLVHRHGFQSIEEMRSFFAGNRRVLDAGCGSAFSSSLVLNESWPNEWVGADISAA